MNPEQSNERFSEVRSVSDVRTLAQEILSRDREHPIIGLTAAAGEDQPSLSVQRIRTIVGPDTPIYFIACWDMARLLSYFLPRCLGVNRGGARLWWPGVDKASRPEDHPRFYDVQSDYQEEVYDWLEGEFRPPLTPCLTFVGSQRTAPYVRLAVQPQAESNAHTALMTAMKVLPYFADGRTMERQQVARRANISRSLAARCLTELTALGYLTETQERGYRLAGAMQRLRVTAP